METTTSHSHTPDDRVYSLPAGCVEGFVAMADLLGTAQPGGERSMSQLLPLVYRELKALAAAQLSRDAMVRNGRAHTLQPTALVHEAYMRMASNQKGWSGREHFLAVASIAMRQVLVDHARRKHAQKRGGDAQRVDVSISGMTDASEEVGELEVLELDELLQTLAKADARSARIAEMRLFGGMEMAQIASVLDLSRMTVTSDWQFARAWLASRMIAPSPANPQRLAIDGPEHRP